MLREQLDIERKRFDHVVSLFTMEAVETFDETNFDKMEVIRKNKNWNSQQRRLQEKSQKEFKEWREKHGQEPAEK